MHTSRGSHQSREPRRLSQLAAESRCKSHAQCHLHASARRPEGLIESAQRQPGYLSIDRTWRPRVRRWLSSPTGQGKRTMAWTRRHRGKTQCRGALFALAPIRGSPSCSIVPSSPPGSESLLLSPSINWPVQKFSRHKACSSDDEHGNASSGGWIPKATDIWWPRRHPDLLCHRRWGCWRVNAHSSRPRAGFLQYFRRCPCQ